jgi:rod shape-determining protein MreD
VILTWRMVARIALLIVIVTILEVSFLGRLTILGATPDVMPVLIVTLGLLGGAVLGAVCGFSAGLLIDMLLFQTLGVSSLVLLTVGYLAGRFREQFELTSSLTAPLLAGALTLFAALMFGAIELMLGVDSPVSLLIVREIVVKGLLGFLLAIPVFPLVRRILRAGLVDHAERERRRERATSPLRTASS